MTPSLVVVGRGGAALRRATASSAEQSVNETPTLPSLLRQPRQEAIWAIARPAMAIGFLRTLYGITDAVWIGRLGSVELEAMGAVTFASWMILVLGGVAGTGVHAAASFHEGAGERHRVGATVCDGLWLSGVLSLALISAASPLLGCYFNLLGLSDPGSGAVRAAGEQYLRWTVAGAFPMAAAGAVASGFKGIGLLRPALAATATSVAFNAIVDPLLIWGCPQLGIPRLGVAGAAIATNLSSLLALVVLTRRLASPPLGTNLRLFDGGGGGGGGSERRNKQQPLSPPRPPPPATSRHFRWRLPLAPPRPREILRIAAIGSPMAASGLLFSAVYVLLGRLLLAQPGGASNLGALGLGQRLESVQYTVNEAFGAAAATLVGQWLGAGEQREARGAAADVARLSALVNVVRACVSE
jgi:Na+-driven multidrug efflux pump